MGNSLDRFMLRLNHGAEAHGIGLLTALKDQLWKLVFEIIFILTILTI